MSINGGECWPGWLERDTVARLGPGISDVIPYPVYQVQPPVISQENPNGNNLNLNDAFFQCASGIIAGGSVGTTIIHVMPNNVYDTILIMALDTARTVPVPIFLSMDRPGRITTETAQQGNPEVSVCVATTMTAALAALDVSSLPTCVQIGQPSTILPYSSLVFSSARSNRSFYLWFGDSVVPAPTNAAFKASWLTQGR